MQSGEKFDVAVIGAGPGGYVCAIRAAQMGLGTCLIERGPVGGTCLNQGCIPTKTLARTAEVLALLRRSAEFGLAGFDPSGVRADFKMVMDRKEAVVGRLRQGVQFLLKKNKVALVKGSGVIGGRTPSGGLEVRVQAGEGETLCVEAQNLVVATGSRPLVFPAFGYDGERVITSDEALSLPELPASMVIIGGGVIGCEFASIFGELGVQVAVVELLPSLLPMLDRDLGKHLQAMFRRRGIQVHVGARVAAVDKPAGGGPVSVQLESGEVLAGDLVLVSVGRAPSTGQLGLETVGVALNSKGEIPVDNRLRTAVDGVYAVGDATDCVFKLAHVASEQGIVAVEDMLARRSGGAGRTLDYSVVPNCVFTLPEIASVGISAETAAGAGSAAGGTTRFPFAGSGKAIAMGEAEGFVKVVSGEDGRILGVHIIGPHASDLIAEAGLALQKGLTAREVAETIHSHPTLPEAFKEACEGVYGMAIHA